MHDRNKTVGHMLYSRQNQLQFKSKNFSTIVRDYLPRDEDVQSIVSEIENKLSTRNSSDLSSTSANNRAGMFIPNPSDSSKALQVDGAILPQDQTVLLLTVLVDELKE